MSRIVYYRQCKLVKRSKLSNTYQVAFIPERYAIIKQRIKIREHGEEEWDTGWEVVEVSSDRREENQLPDSFKEIKSHRKSTGDNTPKVKVDKKEE